MVGPLRFDVVQGGAIGSAIAMSVIAGEVG
jgi:hypothetical protein